MKRFLQEYDEDARHRKKSKTSKTSKSVQRSNHKMFLSFWGMKSVLL